MRWETARPYGFEGDAVTKPPYRVIQWATGGVGRAAIEGILDHPELELVGCWVHSDAKDGRDVGELIGRGPIGVTATSDVDALLALDADCVVYAPLLADPSVVVRILRSGKNVVDAARLVLSRSSDDGATLEAACAAGNVTLHGTGIHPGGITERFPLMVSALSGAITHVRAEEFSDIRTYDAPDVIRDVMLFGKTPEEARTSLMADILGQGFLQSIDMVADDARLRPRPGDAHDARDRGRDRADRLADRRDRAGPRRRAALPLGGTGRRRARRSPRASTGSWARSISIRRGRSAPRASASRSRSRAIRRSPRCSTASTRTRSRRAAAQPRHRRDRDALRERDPLRVRAEPGIQTYLDLPLIAGRAAPSLRRGEAAA